MPIPTNAPLEPQACDALANSFATSYAGVIAFITVATEGSFAKAGERLGIGRSAVSRSVQKLETQLNARLFVRTTRSTVLSREGELFYANCQPGVERIVQAINDMRELRAGPPRGLLRISATVGFGRKVVAPLINGFQALYPDITIDLLLEDRYADFTTDRVDVAIRNGRLDDSQVIAKQLIPMQMHVCASPGYAGRHRLPESLDQLDAHSCLNFRMPTGRLQEWEFKIDGHTKKIVPVATKTFNDIDLVMQACIAGQGIAQLGGYLVSERIRSGELVSCLEHISPDDRGHYICYLSRQQLPSRIRVFVDYMTTHTRLLDLQVLEGLSLAA